MTAQPSQEGMRLPVAEGGAHAQPLAPARAAAQARHLGVDVSLIEKDQAVRLLAHAGLTLVAPDPALIPHIGACAFGCHQTFFDRRSRIGTGGARASRGLPPPRVPPTTLRPVQA